MKTLRLLIVSAAALPLLSGCLLSRPYAMKETPILLYATNGVPLVGIERVTTKSTTFAWGDAKQTVSSLTARSTKTTTSAGAEGVAQESTTAGFQQMFEAILRVGMQMGRTSAGVPPVPGQ